MRCNRNTRRLLLTEATAKSKGMNKKFNLTLLSQPRLVNTRRLLLTEATAKPKSKNKKRYDFVLYSLLRTAAAWWIKPSSVATAAMAFAFFLMAFSL